MKYDEIQIGQTVRDGDKLGIVEVKLKTRVKIRFIRDAFLTTYDIPHLQFLQPYEF